MLIFISALLFDLTKSAAAAAVGFLFARLVLARLEKSRFGGWRILVRLPDGTVGTDRPISVVKARAILDDDADLSVYVKGVASTYGWINCDPTTRGREIGLLVVDSKKREILVDLAQNPPKTGGPNKV